MYYIGVDAGGTKTYTAIVDQKQKIIFEYKNGPGNIAVAYDEAKTNILAGIKAALSSAYGPACKGIVIGVAGAGKGSWKQVLQSFLSQHVQLPVLVISDAELAYYSIFQNESGILAIAGTGSIFLTKMNGQFRTFGGWGHLLGDEGSAYDIGIHALKIIANELDAKGISSTFAKVLAEKYNIQNSNLLKEFVYSCDKAAIAEVSFTVYELAKKGEHQARELLTSAGIRLAEQALRFLKIFQTTDPVHIACKGSLLEKNEIVFQAFKEKLLEGETVLSISKQTPETVTGAKAAWLSEKEG